MEDTRTRFVKLFDERIANALNDGGFSYIRQQINGEQEMYCFEETDELLQAIEGFCEAGNFQDVIIIRDSALFV